MIKGPKLGNIYMIETLKNATNTCLETGNFTNFLDNKTFQSQHKISTEYQTNAQKMKFIIHPVNQKSKAYV